MKTNKINSNFSFAMTVTKAYAEEQDGDMPKMIIKGVASNTRRDKENHQFTLQGLNSIKKAIEDGVVDEDGEWSYVPLRSGHKSEWEDHLGAITKAEIDDNENLWITAELDPDSSKAKELYVKVSKGNAVGRKPQLGLSVKGKTTKYHFGYDATQDTQITFLDNLIIEEVSVTSKPKNPTPYPLAIAKSLLADPEYTQALEENMTLSKNANPNDDPIAKAIQKSQEARNAEETTEEAPAVETTAETTETNEEQASQATGDNDGQVSTAEAEQLSQEQAEAAESIQREETPASTEEPTPADTNTENDAQAATTQEEVSSEPAAQSEQPSYNDLLTAVSQLSEQVKELAQSQQQEPVEAQKAETVTETPAESVTLAQSDDVDDRVALAVAKAFKQLGLDTVAGEIQVVKSAIEAIQQQPNDKSIAVSKAKDENDENDPRVRYEALKAKGVDPLTAAMQTAYPKK